MRRHVDVEGRSTIDTFDFSFSFLSLVFLSGRLSFSLVLHRLTIGLAPALSREAKSIGETGGGLRYISFTFELEIGSYSFAELLVDDERSDGFEENRRRYLI